MAAIRSILRWSLGWKQSPTTVPPTPTPTENVFGPSFQQQDFLTISVFSPAVLGTPAFIQNITSEVESYTHTSRAIGGYWSSKITINDKQTRIEDWIQRGLGRHIVTYNPALQIVWEGFVNKITANLGPLTFILGPLLDVGNRIRVVYSTVDTSTSPPTLGVRAETDNVNNTDSQALYGILEKIISQSGMTATQAEQLRDAHANEPSVAFPATSRKSNLSQDREPSVRLDCLGYWHWLKTYTYASVTEGTQNLSDKIIAILNAEVNGTIFNSDTTGITENTFQVNQAERNIDTAESNMLDLNSFGDVSDQRYNMGFYANRRFIYSVIPTNFEYQQRLTDTVGIVDKNESRVKPWDVNPAEWLFYPDFLVGRLPPLTSSVLNSDPRVGFIEQVKFTAPYALSVNGEKVNELDQFLAKFGLANSG